MTLELLRRRGYETASLRCKSWDEFAAQEGPRLDFVITVCDNAAGEVCPVWPGWPATAHWSIDDSAAFVGIEERQREAFESAYVELENRIRRLVSLPIESLDRESVEHCATEIERDRGTNRGNQNTEQ
jgi:arsenate reductase